MGGGCHHEKVLETNKNKSECIPLDASAESARAPLLEARTESSSHTRQPPQGSGGMGLGVGNWDSRICARLDNLASLAMYLYCGRAMPQSRRARAFTLKPAALFIEDPASQLVGMQNSPRFARGSRSFETLISAVQSSSIHRVRKIVTIFLFKLTFPFRPCKLAATRCDTTLTLTLTGDLLTLDESSRI